MTAQNNWIPEPLLPVRDFKTISYIVVSPVNEPIAHGLFGLGNWSENRGYWIQKQDLDEALAQLGNGKLEMKILRNPVTISQFPKSVIYCYDEQRDMVRVPPKPFGVGEEVQKYFVTASPVCIRSRGYARSPDYAGKITQPK